VVFVFRYYRSNDKGVVVMNRRKLLASLVAGGAALMARPLLPLFSVPARLTDGLTKVYNVPMHFVDPAKDFIMDIWFRWSGDCWECLGSTELTLPVSEGNEMAVMIACVDRDE